MGEATSDEGSGSFLILLPCPPPFLPHSVVLLDWVMAAPSAARAAPFPRQGPQRPGFRGGRGLIEPPLTSWLLPQCPAYRLCVLLLAAR